MSIKKVLLLGSGGLRIGQAGEFDYSGSQAIKAFKQHGIHVVLVNPNIATVQTDPGMADTLYLQPLNVQTVTEIIKREHPDAIALSFGGQTALNLGLALERENILETYGVRVLGTPLNAIRMTEDRALFCNELQKIHVQTPKSIAVESVDDAVRAAKKIGYPIMMRSGYSLGGLGSGKVEDEKELKEKATQVLHVVPQILIEEYLVGWKEIEYEIVRDCDGNTLTVCNMENLDPMGVHTGESIVVAPSQTLTNEEYHRLREVAITVANHIGIVGECNVQFALDPKTSAYRVIEMNARLSRSSALASKATGYPLAFVAAQLALGKRLHEIPNAVTQKTTAFFEPALDYIVVKIPRWDIHKFKGAEKRIGSEMKSVGEVMAIGRSFPEALQKAIRMLNIGASGLHDYPYHIEDPEDEIRRPTFRRLFAIYQMLKKNVPTKTLQTWSHIDPWFLHHIQSISEIEQKLCKGTLTDEKLREAKQYGFADKAIAACTGQTEEDVRKHRHNAKILPVMKQVDTLAGEFPAKTNYLYLTYHGDQHDLRRSQKRPIIVLGSGPYCIGSSVEFDWCAVNTARTLRREKESTIIINSNPETVSTDYDESDRLYFEELTLERIRDIADFEKPTGIIVSVGGQIPNNLALPLAQMHYPIFGTAPRDIDRAENRKIFSALLNTLGIDQPLWKEARTVDDARDFAASVGYPILIRPSYVLSGAAMAVITNERELSIFLKEATVVSPEHPIVVSQFIQGAKELEVDGIAKHGEIILEAVTEHVENAGVHSGDATLVLPPQKLYVETLRRAREVSAQIVRALNIHGPFNIQFLAKENELKVIECNVRASRSFPFVSKVTNNNFIDITTKVLLGKKLPPLRPTSELSHVGVKTPQFSYNRLKGADPVAHVEMNSTGEVACIANNFLDAFFLSWLATEQTVSGKRIFVSIGNDTKRKFVSIIAKLKEKGWEIYTTEGTHHYLLRHGIRSQCQYKISERIEPNVQTLISQKQVDIIINIPTPDRERGATDGFVIRRLAIDHHIPLITNIETALVFLRCLVDQEAQHIPVTSWQEFTSRNL